MKTHPNFTLLYLFKGPTSKYSCLLRYWGLELAHMNLGRNNSAYNIIIFHNYYETPISHSLPQSTQ